MTYRINLPILAISSQDGHNSVVTVPAGRLVEVLASAVDKRFVVAGMSGERLTILAADLANRSVATVQSTRQPAWSRA